MFDDATASPAEQVHDAVTRRPLDPARLMALYDVLGSDADRRSRVAQVLVLADAANEEQTALARASMATHHIRPRRALTPELIDAHLRHPDEGPITGSLLASVSRAVLARHKQSSGETEDAARRLLDMDSELAKCFAWAARILAMREPKLYLYPEQRVATRLTADHPPDLRVGGLLLGAEKLSPRELAFAAGRAIAATAPARMMRWMIGDVPMLKDTLAAAVSIVEPRVSLNTDVVKRVHPIARAVQKQLTGVEVENLRRTYERFSAAGGRTHVGMWAEGAEHTAARAGLLLCDDIAAAARMLERDRAPRLRELIGDLIAFFTSREFRALRETMGLAPPPAARH